MPPTSEFLDANDVRLHYLHWDAPGPPLIILHGNGHCGGVYAPLAERLSSHFRVLAVDLRGHGLSDKPDSYGWHDLRDDILGIIDQLGLDDVLLVAHSRGGGVSLLAAATRPERIRGVLVYEPSVPQLLTNPARMLEVAARTQERRSRFSGREEMYEHFRNRGAFKGWQDEYLKAYTEHGAIDLKSGGVELASPPHVEAQLYRALVDWSGWDESVKCDVPVRVLYGERGGRVRDGIDPAVAIRQQFPDTESFVLADCTHSGPMERPDLFEASIRDFAARLYD